MGRDMHGKRLLSSLRQTLVYPLNSSREVFVVIGEPLLNLDVDVEKQCKTPFHLVARGSSETSSLAIVVFRSNHCTFSDD